MSWMLRRASVDDLENIMVLERGMFATDAWSVETMRHELDNPFCHYLVAVRVGDLAQQIDGYGGVHAPPGASDADIQTIAVAETARRQGLGRTLMRQLMTEARQRGARQVFLEVRADNPGAQALYTGLGFEAIATRKGYYQPDNVDAVVMRSPIREPRSEVTS
ncbi:MAG: rimI [Homoserinimonas sp.]|jgi:ribosomal-protein-alanine N-acetyltransferase|nr:rimI [Homoserinimonas sp.]